MSLQSIIEDMEALEAQLERIQDDSNEPLYEIVYAALKMQRAARQTLERGEIYDDEPSGASDGTDSEARADDMRQRAREVVL